MSLFLPGRVELIDIKSIWAIYPLLYHKLLLFHQVPITAGWTEALWNEKFTQHFYT